MSHSRRTLRSLAVAIWGLGILHAPAVFAADRVNAMTTFRQGSVQPWQVRPGVTVPVFGNATDSGFRPGDGSANGESYTFAFSANPNVQVITDGSLTGSVANDRYIFENVSFNLLGGSTREVVSFTLTVDDGAGSVDSETREIDVVDPSDPISDTPLENLSIEVNIAIQDGLRAMYLEQQADGRWRHGRVGGAWDCATTGFTIWAFGNSGHQPTNDFDEDIYAEFVQHGVDYILSQASIQTPVNQSRIGSPDGDGNGRMISLCGPNNRGQVGYATPIAAAGLMAAYSSAPGTLVPSGGLAGESYSQVIQDTIDWIAFGQHDSGSLRGGWRYNPNGGSDTSSDSWSYVAQEGFEAVFGGSVLELVKQEAERRINTSQSQGPIGDRGQFGYTGTGPLGFDGNATTAGGLSGLVMVTAGGRVPPLLNGALSSSVFPNAESRKAAAVAHLGLRWDATAGIWTGNRNNFYAMWTTARALRLNGTSLLVDRNGVTFDWETGEDQANPGVLPPANSVHEGYFPFLVRTQAANGAWNATVNGGNWTRNLNTAWGVLILQPTVFGPPPVANLPPVALCQDPTLFTEFGACSAAAGVDAGSFDPEGGDLMFVQEPPGPYSPVETPVTLTVEDPGGQTASCEATVTVTDPEPPQIACNAPALIPGEAGAAYSFTATASDNCQPGFEVAVEVNSALCEDDDGDDDGVPDDQDDCSDSDLSDEVIIAECATGVINVLFPSGCTISDLIIECGVNAANHGEFVSCVAHLTNELVAQGVITGREKGAIQRCAAQAPIPPDHPGGGNSTLTLAEEEACEVTVDGGTVSFPDGPNSGLLEWTVSATDGFGNTTTETCSVVIQDPDTPLPNLPPVADAGSDQVVPGGATVLLDGSGSTDVNGDALTYVWTLAEVPAGSAAALDDPTAVSPSFVADRPGFYTVELVVNDGLVDSAPDAMRVRALNGRPVASAGPDQEVFGGETVQLDGSGSFDPEGAVLTYQWTLAFTPAGSAAVLDDPTSATPTFDADLRGTYVAQLVVSDGELTSLVDAVIVRAVNRLPVAEAGPDQEISVFDTVQLDGTGSFDGDGDPITYAWSFTTRPAGSAAELDDPTSVTPSFFADLAGTYVLELVVNDGFDDSQPEPVSIVTVNTPPVANAGPDQTAFLGDTVTLDGTGSFDLDGDVLSYQWTILNRPAGSTATLSDPTSPQPTFVVDARGIFEFQLVVDDGQRTSRQPDTVQVTVPNRVPVADAGEDQTVFVGDTVQLDGSGSSDPDDDPLTFAWSFASVPPGSAPVLSDPTSPQPTFVTDARGTYVVRLVVNDGIDSSAPDTVTITVPNRVPVADAGPDQSVFVTDTVYLDGSGSSDPDGDPLTFAWTFVNVPVGSTATLSDPAAVNPSFVVDLPGTYVVELVVHDGIEVSAPDTVTIITLNSPPVADAGPDQEVLPGDVVQLDGSGSFDVDGDPLTYLWSFVAVPAGSAATLSDPTAVNPTFVVDVVGAYLVQLVVNDGMVDSAPDTVSIATGNVAPVADAGPDQTAFVGDTVQLDGSGSFDANGDAITYAWSFVSVPASSGATLSNPAAVNPTFEVDLFGTYVVQLVVNDGEFDSDPDTVTVTTENSRPVADAGPDQVVLTGSTVFLDGSASFDVDGDSFTFSWSLTTVPAGSTAALSDPTAVDTFFVADVVGVYVAQLIVNDGDLDSVPDTVMIEASDDVATVPDVVGLDQAGAEAAILAAGLVVGDVARVPSGTVPEGEVIEQDPTGDTTVLAGSAVNLVVSAGLDPDLLAEILVLPESDSILVGDGLQLTAFGIFGDGTSSNLTTTALWSSSDSAVAQVDATGFVVGAGAGVATITAEFDGVVGAAVVTVEARVNDGVPPTAQIASPEDTARITTPVEVVGIATDANFLKYELAISPAGDGTFTTIATGTSPVVSGGLLGTFDPTLLINGLYDLRLRVFDQGGLISTATAAYLAEGQQKVGAFTLAFTDVEVSTSGMPIQVVRTYDSRDKAKGDFGVGWSLEIRKGSYRNNRMPGEGWQILPGFLPCQFAEETVPHLTTIQVSELEVYEFRLRLVNPAPTLGACFAQATFEFVDGPVSGATLQILGNIDVLWISGSNEVVDFDTLEVYEPRQVRLTTPDGRTFDLDLAQGVTRLVDLNGNALRIGSSGISHSSGKSVSFTRDSQGRIKTIVDPVGQVISYDYDSLGNLAAVTDQAGSTTHFTYNLNHGLLDIVDPRGIRPIRNDYDDQGRLIRHTDAFGNMVEFSHDLAARIEVITDRLGHSRVLSYDERGNVVQEVDEGGGVVLRTFDAKDRLLSETDPFGNTTTFTYDSAGNQISITDPLGNTTTRTFNARGQVLTITDPEGGTRSNTYNALGNLTSTTDARGNRTTFTYDTSGNLLTETDPGGNVTTSEYDSVGNLVRQIDALGNETTFTYDALGRRLTKTTTRTLSDGSTEVLTTRLAYDARSRLTSRTDPRGATWLTEYDEAGSPVRTVDPLGRETTFEYDFLGRLIETRYPDGTAETRTYDAGGRVLTETDRAGRTTRFFYDALGRVTSTNFPDGTAMSRSYDAAGRVVSETNERGHASRFEYDAAGRRTKLIDALGNEVTFAYDGNGNRISVTDARGETTRFEYDAANNLVRTIFPDGIETSSVLDAQNRTVAETDAAGNTTVFGYDSLGHLTSVTDALGQLTTFSYDEVGNRTNQADANGNVTRFAFDSAGRVKGLTLPDGTSQTLVYDSVGNIIEKTRFDGTTVTFSYDAVDRMTAKVLPDGSSVTFTYTPTGMKSSVTDDRGATVYSYDDRDRLIGLTYPDGRRLLYEYDAAGNRTALTAEVGSSSLTTTYTYDALNRLEMVLDPDGRRYEHTYNANGSRISLSYPNGVVTSYVYDASNRLTNLVSRTSGGATLQAYAYTLGPTGKRTAVTEADGVTRTYSYDALFRLVGERVTDGSNLIFEDTFSYDPVGNRVERSRTDQSGTVTVHSTYDERDRLLSEGGDALSWDANGNLVARSGTEGVVYLLDTEDRLIRLERDDGTIVLHDYDADGNRVRTEILPPGGAPLVTEFLVDPADEIPQVVAETDAVGTLTAYYVRGADLLAVLRPSGPRFFHADGLGSIRILTDFEGAITDRYTFTAFGELYGHAGSDENAYLFAGEAFDVNSGFYYLRARWMDPAAGRFTSQDPFAGVLREPLSLHKYLYAHLDAVNNTDPTGEFISAGNIGIAISIAGTLLSAYSIYEGIMHISEGQVVRGAVEVGLGFMGVGSAATSIRILRFLGSPANAAIRRLYLSMIDDLAVQLPRLRAAGQTSEQIARTFVAARNAAKAAARAKMIEEGGFAGRVLVKGLEIANRIRYGHPLGPTAEALFARKRTWEAVIDGALRANEAVNRFFGVL